MSHKYWEYLLNYNHKGFSMVKNNNFLLAFGALLTLALLVISSATFAEHCPSGLCKDGERSKWYHCCGKGKCNLFCRNCDGGCRTCDKGPKECCEIACTVQKEYCFATSGGGSQGSMMLVGCSLMYEDCRADCKKLPLSSSADQQSAPETAPEAAQEIAPEGETCQRFSEMDADQNNQVSLDEVKAWFKQKRAEHGDAPDWNLEELFNELDQNRDGVIDQEESKN